MWEIFQSLLKEQDIKVAEFCRQTGIKETTISTWGKRGGLIGTKNAIIIADYFGVSLDYLLRGKETGPTGEVLPAQVIELVNVAKQCPPDDVRVATAQLKRILAYYERLSAYLSPDEKED